MQRVSDIGACRLEVHGPGFLDGGSWRELRCGDAVIARLEAKPGPRGYAGMSAVGRSADGDWSFEAQGVYGREITVRESGSHTLVSTYSQDRGAAVLGIPVVGDPPSGSFRGTDGSRYVVSWATFTTNWRLEVSTQGGESLIVCSRDPETKRPTFVLSSDAGNIADMPWMLLLCCFLPHNSI